MNFLVGKKKTCLRDCGVCGEPTIKKNYIDKLEHDTILTKYQKDFGVALCRSIYRLLIASLFFLYSYTHTKKINNRKAKYTL